jgi:thiol-disulfide isomerase/thioredoxin
LSPASPTRRPARAAASPVRKPAAPAPGRKPSSPAPGRKPPSSKRLPIALIIGVALIVGLVVVIVITMGSGGTDPAQVGTPTITGQALPEFDTVQNDTALGMTIPEVAGADFAGTPVSITLDGKPKMLIFFAHWCSVCQREVPLISGWLPEATLPQDLEIISVSTGVSPNSGNYPPSRWLERENWPAPVILDDAQSSVGTAFGLSAYPYFVFVDADGRVALRATGGLAIDAIEQIITQLVGA